MELFEEAKIGRVKLKNRIIRSATFEGAADENGFPTPAYHHIYKQLAAHGVGAVITGFTYIDAKGKAMHPGQAGSDSMEKVEAFSQLTKMLHHYDCCAFMQIAHTGRQTLHRVTGSQPVGASSKKSLYFNETPHVLTTDEVDGIVDKFGNAALVAQQAGFDGVQLHAAHGYLIHQFLLPSINHRKDEYKPEPKTNIGTRFLEKIIGDVRLKCGSDFPILVKISASDDYRQPFTEQQFLHLIAFLDQLKVDAIEISYGTMDYPFNIFRGGFPEKDIFAENGIYKHKSTFYKWFATRFVFPSLKKRFKPLKPMYNLPYAELARQKTQIPIIVVGGFKNGSNIAHAIRDGGIDFVSLCRPFIAEPNLVTLLKDNPKYKFKCVYCNRCAVMCDSVQPTQCYHQLKRHPVSSNCL